MQSLLSLALWRVAIERVDDPKIKTCLLNQLKARDDREIIKAGWSTVLRGWQNKPQVNPADLVHGLPEELLFATVNFKLGSSTASYSARLFLAGGRLSEMEFSKPITFERQKQEPSWTEVNLNELVRAGGQERPSVEPVEGILAHWARIYGMSEMGSPLSPDHETLLMSGLEFQLPAGYLGVLRQANGFTVGPLEIYAIDAIQTTEDQGCRYLIVGTGADDQFLVVKQHWPNLLCVDHEFAKVQDLGTAFIVGIEKLLG